MGVRCIVGGVKEPGCKSNQEATPWPHDVIILLLAERVHLRVWLPQNIMLVWLPYQTMLVLMPHEFMLVGLLSGFMVLWLPHDFMLVWMPYDSMSTRVHNLLVHVPVSSLPVRWVSLLPVRWVSFLPVRWLGAHQASLVIDLSLVIDRFIYLYVGARVRFLAPKGYDPNGL